MGQMKGAVLTDRDRILLSYLGVARYASTMQLHLLVADGLDVSVMYRRMRRLSATVNRPGQYPCVRRLQFRKADGTAVVVWTLTPYGRSIAESDLPYLRPPSKADVGYQFMLHTLMLNDVLLDLVLCLRRASSARLAELPFRWLCENDQILEFSIFRHELGKTRTAVLKPDAIMEAPSSRRRLFLEAETGTQSIMTADPAHSGAVVKKLERYARFFTGLVPGSGPSTFYANSFRDGYAPELVFLVHSDGRKAKVEGAVRDWSRGRGLEEFVVRVFTFKAASTELMKSVGSPTAASPAPRLVSIDDRLAQMLRDSVDTIAEGLRDAEERAAGRNGVRGMRADQGNNPAARLRDLRRLIDRELLGERRPDEPGGGSVLTR
jgi:hypothetical protein